MQRSPPSMTFCHPSRYPSPRLTWRQCGHCHLRQTSCALTWTTWTLKRMKKSRNMLCFSMKVRCASIPFVAINSGHFWYTHHYKRIYSSPFCLVSGNYVASSFLVLALDDDIILWKAKLCFPGEVTVVLVITVNSCWHEHCSLWSKCTYLLGEYNARPRISHR